MTTLQEFSAGMGRTAERVRLGVSSQKRRLALLIDQTVVVGTPVKTGRARSNWMAFAGTPDLEITRETLGPGAASLAISEARGVIEGVAEQDIHLVNNLSYIVPLNEGHSAQAPAGYVEQAIDYAITAIKAETL